MRMKTGLLVTLLLISCVALAQSNPKSQPSAPTSGQSSMPNHSSPQSGAVGPGAMRSNMQQHMQEVKAALAQMKQDLEAMKADTAMMDNQVANDYMQKNNDLWQKMVDHLSMMTEHMDEMQNTTKKPAAPDTTPRK